METIVELVCKLIEQVRVVSNPGEQNQSLACAAPIQDLKLDARLDRDKLTLCPEISHPQISLAARSCVAQSGAADPTGAVAAFQTLRPNNAQTTKLPRIPSAIRSQNLPFPHD
jgi:hypothetical protein